MTLALYGKSRKRRGGLLLAALLAVIAATIGGLALVGTAFAHTPHLSGQATCQSDGKWSVTWTATNSETHNPVNLTVVSTTPNSGSATTPAFSPATLPGTLDGGALSSTATTPDISASATQITLKVHFDWQNDNGSDTDTTAKAYRPSGCSPDITKSKDGTGLSDDGSHLKWKFVIDMNNAPGPQTFVITDADTTVVLDSASNATCTTIGTASPWTCVVAAGQKATVKVSRPVGDLTADEQCKGKDFTNSATATRKYGNDDAVAISVDSSNTKITVGGNSENCLTIVKELTDSGYKITVTNNAAHSWDYKYVKVTDTFDDGGTGEAVTGVSTNQNLGSSCDSYAELHSGCAFLIAGAGATEVFTITVDLGTNRTCDLEQTTNTAELYAYTGSQGDSINLPAPTLVDSSTVNREYKAADCTGTLIVKKVVSGSGASNTDSFWGEVDKASDDSQVKTFTDLSANNPKTYNDLAYGTYYTQETNNNGYTLQGYTIGTYSDGQASCPSEARSTTATAGHVTIDAQNPVGVLCIYNQKDAQVFQGSCQEGGQFLTVEGATINGSSGYWFTDGTYGYILDDRRCSPPAATRSTTSGSR